MSRPKIVFGLAGLFLVGFLVASFQGMHQYSGWLLTAFFVAIALGFRSFELLKGYSFTISIFAAVTLAMYYPEHFVYVGEFKLSKLIIPLMQIIMFGMGTSLSIGDFKRVLQMPKGVVIGILCQYTIMPFVGFSITLIFDFPPEVAAGVILIGSCPGGLASNVMSYLARANLALSVTLTAISTLVAPVVTPALMQWLAGQYLEIDFWSMMVDILKIIILPIAAGLLFHYLLHGKFSIIDKVLPVVSMAGITLIIVVITAAGRNELLVVGPMLIVAMLLHNTTGYVLGYWSARFLRMSESDCRTIAIEVGLQNGGMASGLALSMGKLATVGLAPAVFAPVMNITGSSLALWWRAHIPPEDHPQSERTEKKLPD